ncbi:hypothetical protein EDC04DRAFT_2521182, partial [Pisolithus marmoratus]
PFPSAGAVFNISKMFLKQFEMDPYSSFHHMNLYYPFANLEDWEMANFLLQSKLSMVKIDAFLSLGLVCLSQPFYFELLPTGPCWHYRIISMSSPMKSQAILYFHDSLECIKVLFSHPYYADHMIYTPFQVFTSAERVIREFSE